jgi:hypothetical protein
MLDIRKPIGLLFLIIGAILTVYALVQPQITTLSVLGDNPHDLRLNLNLPCGISMLVFAVIMLGMSFSGQKKHH